MTISDTKVYELIEFNERSEEKIRKLTAQNEKLRAAVQDNNSKYGGLDKDALKSIRVECKDFKAKLTKANEFSSKIQDELLLYQKKLQKRKETVTSLQGEKSKYLKQIERLTTQNRELEKKVYNLESKLDNATTQISYLKKELNKYKDSSIVLVEGTNESISEQCADRAIDKSTIQLQTTKIRKLEDELSQKSDELSSMQSTNRESINMYREQVSALEGELQKYKDNKDTSFKELQKSEAKIFELINKRDSSINQLPIGIIKNDTIVPIEPVRIGSEEHSGIMDFVQTGGGPDDLPTTEANIPLLGQDTEIDDGNIIPPNRILLFIIGAIFFIIIIIYLIFSNKKQESLTVLPLQSQPVNNSKILSNNRKFIYRK